MQVSHPGFAVEALSIAIEVFATNIESAATGAVVQQALQQHLPFLRVSFDLEDCDHILRVQAIQGNAALWQQVVAIVQGLGIHITALPD